MRRTAVILLLLAVGGLLAACGKSAHFGNGKGSDGRRESSLSAEDGQALTQTRAVKLAQTLNLRASDLPGFTASREHKHDTLVEKALERKLARCMGGKRSSAALAEASSKSFERHAQVVRLSVSSSVTIVATPEQATAELKAIRGGHARVCLTRFMRELLAKQAQGGASARLVSIDSGRPSATGTSGAFAWRITGEFTLHEVKIPFYIELVGFAHGQDEVQMLSFGLPVPFPASAEQELFSLLVARADAGGSLGSGKDAKPPKATIPTGPRRVEISL